jgi:1,4-dihydroxy-2-naphthoyl-CoA hydrolase
VADQALTERVRAQMPLAEFLGFEVVEAGPERVEMELAWREELCTAGGILHGGVLMALADAAGALCAFLGLPEGVTGTATIESKTNFFAPVREGRVRARSEPLHRGKTTIVIETDLFDDAGKRVARVTQTQAVLGA